MIDEIFSAVEARPKRRQGITGQTIDAQMRGTICQITEMELEELRDELARLRAEVERLTAALSDERAHADALAGAAGALPRYEPQGELCHHNGAAWMAVDRDGYWLKRSEVLAALSAHRARRQG